MSAQCVQPKSIRTYYVYTILYSIHFILYPLYAMFLAVTHWSQSKFIVGGQKPPPPSKTHLVLIAADYTCTLFIAFYEGVSNKFCPRVVPV